MEEMALAQRGDENIVEAVVIVITYSDSESEDRDGESGAATHVGERIVVIVVIELQRGRARVSMSREIRPVHQQDVGISIVVIVDERASRAHSFRKPLLTKRSVVVRKANTGLGGNVLETDTLLSLGALSDAKCNQPRRNIDTEQAGEERSCVSLRLCDK